jgi:hypothetical protein
MAGPRIGDEDDWTEVWEIDQDTTEIPESFVKGMKHGGVDDLRQVLARYEEQFPELSAYLRDRRAEYEAWQRGERRPNRHNAAKWRNPPEPSVERAAKDILVWGGRLLLMVESNPQLQGPVALALRVGGLIGDAQGRFGRRGADARSGLKSRRGGSKGGMNARARATAAEQEHNRIAAKARAVRRSNPYDRAEHHTQWLIETVAKHLGKSAVTVKRVLGARKIH